LTLAAIWFAVTAYNLFKPYHVDDTAHLEIARWIAAHPLHPMSGTLNWHGVDEPIYLTNQPHLYFYLLALWGTLFSYGEAAMHVLQAFFSLAAILLFHRIALRLVPAHAIWLTGMLALGPSFVVEQNLMVDVPLLALWLLFFHALIAGADADAEGQPRRFRVAALACAGALLVKYSSLILLPILIAVIIYERRWRFGWAVLVPLVTLGAWSAFNYLDYGGIHIAERPPTLEQGFYLPPRQFVAWILTLGAITPFGLVTIVRLFPALHRRGPAIYTMTALLLTLLVAAVAAGQLGEWLADKILRAAFLANAGAMVAALAVAAFRRLADRRAFWPPSARDSRLLILLLWIAGHLAFYSLFAPFMAVRHLLLVLPAVLLVGSLLWPARLPRADATFGLLVSLILAGALGWADWRAANFFRDEAATIRATLPAGAHIWFTGHWGWQWYAEQNGLRALDVERSELVPGDFLVVPRDVPGESIRNLPPLVPLRTDSKPPGIGDLFCTAALPGFYITRFIESPWHLTRSCTNIVDIYRAG
jgi:hypothetical protein